MMVCYETMYLINQVVKFVIVIIILLRKMIQKNVVYDKMVER